MTPRETWILENLAPSALEAARSREGCVLDERGLTALFRAADPSRNASATAWLVASYTRGGFRLEDLEGGPLSKAAGTLEAFARHRGRLDPVERSLNRHAGLSALWSAVAPFEETRLAADEAAVLASATGRERRLLEREKARRESIVLREDEVCTVSIPLTRYAARWWGRGTQWCTAAENHNAFGHYAGSPLVVVTLPDGRRVQAYGSTDEMQVMDETDRRLLPEDVAAIWPAIGPVLLWMQERWGGGIAFMPPDAVDETMWSREILRNPAAIVDAPPHLLTREMVVESLARRGDLIGWLPDAWNVPSVLHEAVARKGSFAARVPRRMMTPEAWRAAVDSDPMALRFLPADLRDEATCRDAVARDGAALEHVPGSMGTRGMCLLALASSPAAIRSVPPEVATDDMYLDAVARSPTMMQWIPERLVTRETCLAAVAVRANMMKHVPERFLDEAFLLEAVRTSRSCLYGIPDALVTETLYLEANAPGPMTPQIPGHLQTPAFCERVAAQGPGHLRLVPADFRTPAMYSRAVAGDWHSLMLVPDSMRTVALCDAAVAQSAFAIDFVPARLRPLLTVAVPDKIEPDVVLGWDPAILDGLRDSLARTAPPVPAMETAPASAP